MRHCHDARDVVLLETVLLLAEVSHQVAPRLVVLNKTVYGINATVTQTRCFEFVCVSITRTVLGLLLL
jgi:hypothetical protein